MSGQQMVESDVTGNVSCFLEIAGLSQISGEKVGAPKRCSHSDRPATSLARECLYAPPEFPGPRPSLHLFANRFQA